MENRVTTPHTTFPLPLDYTTSIFMSSRITPKAKRRSVSLSVGLPADQFVGLLAGLSVCRSVCRFVGRFAGLSVGRSVGRLSLKKIIGYRLAPFSAVFRSFCFVSCCVSFWFYFEALCACERCFWM